MNLVLVEDESLYPLLKDIDTFNIYRPVGKYLRCLRYLHHHCGIIFWNLKKYWLDSWQTRLDQYDQVVIFDSLLDDYPLDFLYKHKKTIKLCYRNKLSNNITHSKMSRNPIFLKDKYNCEIWSYSYEDCEKFGLNHYCQFHLIPETAILAPQNVTFDTFFIGRDKGRMSLLIDILKALTSLNINCYFCVVSQKRIKEVGIKFLSAPMAYPNVIRCVKNSLCVIDVVTDTNAGLTYRCLEAAVFKKKLVTNFEGIKRYNFYCRENVFIWGQDDPSELYDFIHSHYVNMNIDVFNDYSFSAFCECVFNKGNNRKGR